ncbi:MAG: hypothetical protein D3919_11670 [Candidatus Electrothrix sp. AW5]|nr:hypothetical protein [Candidatus Electrothrix gigas]
MGVKFNYEPTPINRELRINILECAIKLEANINTLLLEFLDIPNKVKKKSLSGKTGSLSFKNKIDLLFDLEIINNDEYGDLLLLMEFRNKFLHDLHCNSFKDALSLYGEHRNNKMLNLLYGVQASKQFSKKEKNSKIVEYNSKTEQEKEQVCRESFNNLFSRTVDIFTNKIELSEKKFQDRINVIRKFNNAVKFYLTRYGGFLDSIDKLSKKYNLPDELLRVIREEQKIFLYSEEAQEHRKIDSSCVSLFTQKRRQESQQD